MPSKPPVRSTKLIVITVIIVCALAIALGGFALVNSLTSSESIESNGNTSSPTEPLSARQTRLTTKEALDDYINNLKDSNQAVIKEQNIHDIPELNWDSEDIVAVQYNMYVALTYNDIYIQNINGKDTIVITLDEPSSSCTSIQVNEVHVAFAPVPKGTRTYPVAERINPAAHKEECIK